MTSFLTWKEGYWFKNQSLCFELIFSIDPWILLSHDFRSSRSRKFFKMGVLKNFAILTGKGLCWNLFLIKLPTRRRLQENSTQMFSCKYCKVFKSSFFIEHLRLLLLWFEIFIRKFQNQGEWPKAEGITILIKTDKLNYK